MKRKSSKNILIAFLLNLLFSVIELIGGIFTNSISIISDSVHDFGDAISIAVAWILEKKSEKKPDEKYTFGYARYSVLGAFITSILLMIGSVFMICNAVIRIINPVVINYDGMLMLGILGVIVNSIGAYITSRGNKVNEKAVSLHMLEDVLGWVAVLITSLLMKVMNMPILDPILSIGITIFILKHVIENLSIVFSIFLERAPENSKFEEFRNELIENNKMIKDIHHIHVWSADGVNTYAMMHVVVQDNIKVEDIIELKKEIKHEASHYNIKHITIEMEFESERCKHDECDIEISELDVHSHHHHHHNH